MKKETVMGIMGKTQGVSIAARPARKDKRKNINKESSLFMGASGFISELALTLAVSFLFESAVWVLFSTIKVSVDFSSAPPFPSIVILNSISSGGRHFSSSQVINSTRPVIENVLSESKEIFCLKIAVPLKYLRFISKFLSYSSMPFDVSKTLPTSLKSLVTLILKKVGTGRISASGICWEYKCDP